MDQKIEPQRYRDDRARLARYSYASRALLIFLTLLASYLLPPFDASAKADAFTAPWADALVRWDVFHFAQIARGGYVHEHQWAFFPGVPWLLRATALSQREFLLGGTVLVLLCDPTLVMYDLSLLVLGNRDAALLSALLSLLPSSPMTLRLVPYAEPFYTYLSYRGMLFCERRQWIYATVSFALAGLFRSNGLSLAGFLVWGMLIRPFVEGRARTISITTVLKCALLAIIVFAPFVYHQYTGYRAFCTTSVPPKWCRNTIPLIYSHVQSTYWNVGFLRYWMLQQLPNFVIAAPPLLAILSFASWHLRRTLPAQILPSPPPGHQPFLSPALTPHALHATFMALILLFASHTQIALRLVAAMPFTYWAAAWLMVQSPKIGWAWVTWSVGWGALSVLLWVAFLPPA
ncbi:glycosyltransferase family 76 protein [Schizophyllum amplum]|uniref:GPI mannosyltransferase 2 n=1 Tax=Schizophyllum amplum TaxID=97359 RepID=A0A550CY12_9AGAR|nr:glycosyltransferase family 76 protein [Auriculariopsis ampla]